MKKRISVKDIKDIQVINQIVSGYSYNIWIHSQSGMVDAKSILGIFALSLKEDLYLVIDDDVNPTKLFKELEEYLVIEDEK
jgi:phosphotransferase system HPr-like phosphotransfer protein